MKTRKRTFFYLLRFLLLTSAFFVLEFSSAQAQQLSPPGISAVADSTIDVEPTYIPSDDGDGGGGGSACDRIAALLHSEDCRQAVVQAYPPQGCRYTYKLYRNGGFVTSATGSLYNFTVYGNGTYHVVATNGTGPLYTSNKVTVSKIEPTVAVPYFSGYDGAGIELVCPSETKNFTTKTSQSGVAYKLYRDGVLVSTTSGTGSSISLGSYNTPGSYKIIAEKATNVCKPKTAESPALTIGHKAVFPPSNITEGQVFTATCGASSMSPITLVSPENHGVSLHRWYNSDGNIIQELVVARDRMGMTTKYLPPSLQPGDNIFYVSAYSNTKECESVKKMIRVVVEGYSFIPNKPRFERGADNSLKLYMNNQNTTDRSFYWQRYPHETETTAYPEPRVVTEPGYYFVRSRNSSGCWGPAVSVYVPDFSTPTYPKALTQADVNYVQSYSYFVESTESDPNLLSADQVQLSTSYFDGLGRKVQEVIRQATPDKKDVVMPVHFNGQSQAERSFMPFKAPTSTGEIAGQPFAAQKDFYDKANTGANPLVVKDDEPFAYTITEASPLKRVVEQAAPGKDWQPGTDHTTKASWRANTAEDKVLYWTYQKGTNGAFGGIASNKSYEPGQLVITETSDEDGGKVREYKDRIGQVVLKEVETEGGRWLRTYFVYDDLGQLRAVLPPKFVEEKVHIRFKDFFLRIPYQEFLDGTPSYGREDGDVMVKITNNILTINSGAEFEPTPMKIGLIKKLNTFPTLPDMDLSISWDNKYYLSIAEEGYLYVEGDDDPTERLFLPVKIDLSTVTPQPTSFSFSPSDEAFNNLCYWYQYDKRKRMIEKHEPGTDGVVSMVYDYWDRLVLAQNAEQKKKSEWMYTKYDALNRPIINGYWTDARDRAAMQAEVDRLTTPNANGVSILERAEVRDDFVHGYTMIKTFPSGEDWNKVLKVTYYDDYSFKFLVEDETKRYAYTVPPGFENKRFNSVKGQVTGSRTQILGDNKWLNTVNYYDDKQRVIQSVTDNVQGGTDRLTNAYDFTGKVVKNLHQHQGLEKVTMLKEFTYDHTGRLLETYQVLLDQDITWTSLVGVTVGEDNSLTKVPSRAFPAGASSAEKLAIGEDGWVELTITSLTDRIVFGLATENTDFNPSSVTYGLSTIYRDQKVYVMEKGQNPLALAPFQLGDKLKVARENGIINYYINGVKVHSFGTSNATPLIVDVALYDANNKISEIKTSFGGKKVLLAANEYNDIGQLAKKHLHAESTTTDFLQTIDFQYNIRGWLTHYNNKDLVATPQNINNNDLFGFELRYNTGFETVTKACYNGNIAEMVWTTNNSNRPIQKETQAYNFDYDKLSRLTTANHYNFTDATKNNRYNLLVKKYDANGNMVEVLRKGLMPDNSFGFIDDLTYYYHGNKLVAVNDKKAVSSPYSTDFRDNGRQGSIDDIEFLYDANGSMIQDQNKGIQSIRYNILNLPEEIIFSSNKKIQYTYDAAGIKLRKIVTDGTTFKTTDYIGAVQYQDGVLSFIQHEEGRLVKEVDGFAYVYDLKDHLGNTRVSFTKDRTTGKAKIVQEDHYYPFGMKMAGNSYLGGAEKNSYLYNGKELQEDLGLNWYDYGARFYDPALGKFFTPDRFATKYYPLSPYNYAANNPIKYIDINGDSINVSQLMFQNGQLSGEGLYVLFNVMSDLEKITGLTYSVNGSGNIVVTGTVSASSSGSTQVSSSARTYVQGLISSTSTINITNNNSQSTEGGGIGRVNLNSNQLDDNIATMQNAGLDPLTYGYGMSFLHESLHTSTGTRVMNPNATVAYGDPPRTQINDKGPTVTEVNVFRNELGLPERDHYFWHKASSTSTPTMRWVSGGNTITVSESPMSVTDKNMKRAASKSLILLFYSKL